VLFVWLLTSLWHGNGLAPKYLLWGVGAGAAVALDPLWYGFLTRRMGKDWSVRILGHLPLLALIPVSYYVLRTPADGFNFILWGMSIGLMIVLERLWKSYVSDRFRIGEKLGKGSLPAKLWKALVSLLAHIWVVIPMVLSWVVFTIKDIDQLALYFSRLFPAAGASAGADPADFAKNWKLVGPYVVVGVIFCLPVLDWLKALLSRFNLGKRILRFLDSRLAAWIVSALLAGLFWYAVYALTQTGSDPMGYAAF
jgi:D-alanyl-lipoteichoic acid acyltransferase DltB (MBOAT superfamily)